LGGDCLQGFLSGGVIVHVSSCRRSRKTSVLLQCNNLLNICCVVVIVYRNSHNTTSVYGNTSMLELDLNLVPATYMSSFRSASVVVETVIL